MARRISVGGEDFVALRQSDSYYVDKTELLYELVQESNNAVTLFTRPRRFGKTLTLSMMASFFSVFHKENREVFHGLHIMEHTEFCQEYINQYPVLFLSLKDVEGLNFDSAYQRLCTVLSEYCKSVESLLDSPKISAADKKILHDLIYREASAADVGISLKAIMRMMNAVYEKPVILLIDEYDVPLAKAHENGYYVQMLDLIRGMLSTSLKTNEYLKFAIVTGCLRIPKESIFTGVNNFACYSVLDEEFSPYFGFTQDEVEKLLDDFQLSDKAGIIKEWYDGYLFGDTEIYCPWDVVNYAAALLKNPNAKPKNYWKNTSGNAAIRQFFEMTEFDVSDKFETLLNGGTITETVVDTLTYDNAYDSERNLWSILLMTGYITQAIRHNDESEEAEYPIELRIPNREIAGIFQEVVVDQFVKTVNQPQLQDLMSALWNGDAAKASEILSDLLWHTISYMDYHENYYHAFLAGLFVGRGYEVRSNKERGLGRPDLELRDKSNRRAIIIEAKRSESQSAMQGDCNEALAQIEQKKYAANFDGYKQVMCYGVSFYKKSALVKLM